MGAVFSMPGLAMEASKLLMTASTVTSVPL